MRIYPRRFGTLTAPPSKELPLTTRSVLPVSVLAVEVRSLQLEGLWLTSGSDGCGRRTRLGDRLSWPREKGGGYPAFYFGRSNFRSPTLEHLFSGRSGAARKPILKLTDSHLRRGPAATVCTAN